MELNLNILQLFFLSIFKNLILSHLRKARVLSPLRLERSWLAKMVLSIPFNINQIFQPFMYINEPQQRTYTKVEINSIFQFSTFTSVQSKCICPVIATIADHRPNHNTARSRNRSLTVTRHQETQLKLSSSAR